MEVEEELGEQCVEILENWTSPIYSDSAHTSLHQNPFSLHHHQPHNAAYDVQRVKEQVDSTYSIVSNVPQLSLHARQPNQSLCCTYVETKISTSKPKYEDPQKDFELEHKEDIIMKAPKPTNDKGSKEEEAEKSNNNMGMDRPIIPVLVADTFFDKLLGHAADGIDIASLIEVKEAKACENEAGASTVSANNGKEIDKLNSGQMPPWIKYNFSMANRMPKRPPISGEYRRMPATSTAAPKEIRSCFQRGFVAKLRSMLPSNKTIFDINIDNFGEKMWRNPGVDMSDFFNYGLDEEQWKDYCKLMQAQIEVGRSGPSKITADESRQSLKDGAIGEVKLDRGNDECLPFIYSKDPSFYNADVIIDIAMCDSFYENEIRIQHIKENGVSTDDGGAKLPSDSRNTQSNCRMINWDNILPFPMNSYSAEDRDKREPKEEQSQKNCDGHLTKTSRERKTDFSENNYNVELTGSYKMGKHQSSRKQREHSPSHIGQRNQKRVRFYLWNQTSHHKLDINLAESLCSPRVESVREKIENYASERVQKESASRIIPTNNHNSEIEMEVEDLVGINDEEDPEKLKEEERFKLPFANSEECSRRYISRD